MFFILRVFFFFLYFCFYELKVVWFAEWWNIDHHTRGRQMGHGSNDAGTIHLLNCHSCRAAERCWRSGSSGWAPPPCEHPAPHWLLSAGWGGGCSHPAAHWRSCFETRDQQWSSSAHSGHSLVSCSQFPAPVSAETENKKRCSGLVYSLEIKTSTVVRKCEECMRKSEEKWRKPSDSHRPDLQIPAQRCSLTQTPGMMNAHFSI